MENSGIWRRISKIETFLSERGADSETVESLEELKRFVSTHTQNVLNSQSDCSTFLNYSNVETNSQNYQQLQNSELHRLFQLPSHPTSDSDSSSPKDKGRGNLGWTIGPSRRPEKLKEDSLEVYLSDLGRNWHLDLIGLSNMSHLLKFGPIVVIGRKLLERVGLEIDPQFERLLLPVLRSVQDAYLPNPYHNALHGASVGHMSILLANVVTGSRRLRPLEEFGFVLSSLSHDIGHPGKTNNFLNKTRNPLSLIYNDESVLENYHCSLLFHVLRLHSDFAQLVSEADWTWIRRRVIQLILSTDMKYHFTHINNIKEKRVGRSVDVGNDDDLWLLLILCIKAADIGHNFLPWVDHLVWTFVLFQEFYIQGDEEKALNCELLLYFDRNKSSLIPGSQLNFFNTFTNPLLSELSFFDADNFIERVLLANSRDNLRRWAECTDKSLDEVLAELDALIGSRPDLFAIAQALIPQSPT